MSEALSIARRFTDTYSAAVAGRDKGAIMSLYAPDVRVFDLWSTWSHEGADAWGTSLDAWFDSIESGTHAATFTDLRAYGDHDVVVVESFVRYSWQNPEGQLEWMDNRLTWAIVQHKGEWVVAHEHTSAPVGADDGLVVTKREVDAHHPNS
ncbi:YybH family protein [Pseudoclavibacter sp. VKM Ac-2867]|uniref:YybH family protein n=1 Tax=Pseudoclavibacter sp. VKM Ac-2867 TaxID=2783829 RepID=UPI00188BF99E|nr:nuclear transport factor 2 family protein [Pseudoclavibacter sp. VKM Ac-2867]MBF4459940.1 nuclear transport factor 2 family protein [Pseudoclavibacter sp. VKM Ac-2867]